jgi:hypothetical protein
LVKALDYVFILLVAKMFLQLLWWHCRNFKCARLIPKVGNHDVVAAGLLVLVDVWQPNNRWLWRWESISSACCAINWKDVITLMLTPGPNIFIKSTRSWSKFAQLLAYKWISWTRSLSMIGCDAVVHGQVSAIIA